MTCVFLFDVHVSLLIRFRATKETCQTGTRVEASGRAHIDILVSVRPDCGRPRTRLIVNIWSLRSQRTPRDPEPLTRGAT